MPEVIMDKMHELAPELADAHHLQPIFWLIPFLLFLFGHKHGLPIDLASLLLDVPLRRGAPCRDIDMKQVARLDVDADIVQPCFLAFPFAFDVLPFLPLCNLSRKPHDQPHMLRFFLSWRFRPVSPFAILAVHS